MEQDNGLDSQYKELSKLEWQMHQEARHAVHIEAYNNAHKRPKLTTLIEEMAEVVLAARGKHDHSLELELTQVAACALNLVWQIKNGNEEHVNNLIRHDL